MVTSFTSPASSLARNSEYVGVSSRACAPFAETSFQSITPRKTIEIQNKTVFAVELVFTSSSQKPLKPFETSLRRSAPCLAYFLVPTERKRWLRPVPLGAASPKPTQFLRCSAEPKVIGLERHAAPCRLIQKHRQPDRARLRLAQAAQKKILRYAAIEHRIEHQNVAAFQIGTRAENHFPASAAALFHVANFLTHEMTDHRRSDLPNQIRRKNKAAVERYHCVHAAPLVRARDFPSQAGDPCGNARRCITCASLGAHRMGSSVITTAA